MKWYVGNSSVMDVTQKEKYQSMPKSYIIKKGNKHASLIEYTRFWGDKKPF